MEESYKCFTGRINEVLKGSFREDNLMMIRFTTSGSIKSDFVLLVWIKTIKMYMDSFKKYMFFISSGFLTAFLIIKKFTLTSIFTAISCNNLLKLPFHRLAWAYYQLSLSLVKEMLPSSQTPVYSSFSHLTFLLLSKFDHKESLMLLMTFYHCKQNTESKL